MTNEEIDAEVLDYIERHPFHPAHMITKALRRKGLEARKATNAFGYVQPYRLVDHSLQRLRKKGRIEFSTEGGRRGGWIAKR